MAFNAALMCKKDLIYSTTIALIISYYRSANYLPELCAFNCGFQDYCEGITTGCRSGCISVGFLYGWCTSKYLSFTILYLVYMLILEFFSIVTSVVFVVMSVALALRANI
jgi:hypothetical protein